MSVELGSYVKIKTTLFTLSLANASSVSVELGSFVKIKTTLSRTRSLWRFSSPSRIQIGCRAMLSKSKSRQHRPVLSNTNWSVELCSRSQNQDTPDPSSLRRVLCTPSLSLASKTSCWQNCAMQSLPLSRCGRNLHSFMMDGLRVPE